MSWFWNAEIHNVMAVEGSNASRAVYVAARHAEEKHGRLAGLTVRVTRTSKVPPRSRAEAHPRISQAIGPANAP